MKAIVQSTYGAPDVLQLAEVARPTAGPDEVLIEVHASVVSQGDRRLRSGDFPGITWLPGRLAMGMTGPRASRPGTSFAGRVVEVGSRVTRLRVGDDVFGGGNAGAYSEYLAVKATGNVARMPAGVDYATAAALPYGAVTALFFLRDLAQVKAGERVCVLGASGGVGTLAVQLARHLGATVTGVASGPNLEFVRSLGADHVVDYRSSDFRDADQPYDVILDTVGVSGLHHCKRVLADGGRYLSLLVSARLLWQVIFTSVLGRKRALTGVALGSADELEEVARLAEAGALRPVIAQSFALDDICAAHQLVETGSHRGTVVVDVASPTQGSRRAILRPLRATARGGRHGDERDERWGGVHAVGDGVR